MREILTDKTVERLLESPVKDVFNKICLLAWEDGAREFYFRGTRYPRDHETYKPGYFYSKLPQAIKDKIKAELTSDNAGGLTIRDFLLCGPIEPWWIQDEKRWKRQLKHEKLKFEYEVLKIRPTPKLRHPNAYYE